MTVDPYADLPFNDVEPEDEHVVRLIDASWPSVAVPGTPVSAAAVQVRAAPTPSEPEPDESRKSAAAQLVDLALERYTFGVTPEGDPYAIPLPGGHVVRMLRGGRSSLRGEIAAAYRASTKRIPPAQALADALLVLEGIAQDGVPVAVHLRVGESLGVVWIDLGDTDEAVVRVDGRGWRIVHEDVPVLFRRTALTAAMPTPERGGTLDELWAVLNVTTEDRPLVAGWLVAALGAPKIPHPALSVFGEQGTGKSTASRCLVQAVDPSPVPLRKPPRDPDGWVTAAAGSWVVGLDNLSVVPDWLSDSLCRAVTGDGDVRRQLYTDSGLSVFSFRRAILLNGIDLGGLRGDLSERLVVVNLDVIDEDSRLTEADLDVAWARAWPRVLGALLDLVAGVLERRPHVRLAKAPRMADFAHILAALDVILGTDGVGRYLEQSRSLAADSLTADPFIAALTATLTEMFLGSAADLLAEVTPDDHGWHPGRDWPRNARAVTSTLRRNAPALRKAGWLVEDLGAGNHAKATTWSLTPPGRGSAGVAGNRNAQSLGHSPASTSSFDIASTEGIGGSNPRNPQTRTPPLDLLGEATS
ncbi:hypothetical protein GALL_341330 [mine drainage metagenome]|uniref:ATP-binding protein n=1 Tax=mine drainage metagenome TaxID=410659 RepID=A0A1J5R7C3_9ZZZZ